MLQGRHLRKSYSAVTVISDVSFILNDNQHVGLIGPNGVGKSTLLRCLIGAEPLDAGMIVKSPPDLSVGYLAQAFGDLGERSVGEVVAAARADVLQAEWRAWRRRVRANWNATWSRTSASRSRASTGV